MIVGGWAVVAMLCIFRDTAGSVEREDILFDEVNKVRTEDTILELSCIVFNRLQTRIFRCPHDRNCRHRATHESGFKRE